MGRRTLLWVSAPRQAQSAVDGTAVGYDTGRASGLSGQTHRVRHLSVESGGAAGYEPAINSGEATVSRCADVRATCRMSICSPSPLV